jgi:hypothetical protein
LVNEEARFNGSPLFICEFCGSGYKELGTAEDCEQHCGTLGFASAGIRRKAVHVPKIEIVSLL